MLDETKLAESRWVTKEELCKLTLEDISDIEYNEFIHVLERLTALQFSYRYQKRTIFLQLEGLEGFLETCVPKGVSGVVGVVGFSNYLPILFLLSYFALFLTEFMTYCLEYAMRYSDTV